MARPGLTKHRKFACLSRLLGSVVIARGSLELLWDVAYENGDDLLGKAEDVEYQADWQGAPGILVAALVESEFLDRDGDKYRVHDLWGNAPDYVSNRRKRETERKKDKVCSFCGTIYHSPDERSKYCSNACKSAAWRNKPPLGDTDRDGATRNRDGRDTDCDHSPAPAPAPAPALKIKIKNTVAPAGATVPVSPKKRTAKPRTEHAELSEKIVAYYEEQIRVHPPSRYRAREHIVSILKAGVVSAPVLWECVNQYEPEAARADPQFRKVAGNFFGRDAVYKAYLDAARAEVERHDQEKSRRRAGGSAAGAAEATPSADAR